VGLEPDSRPWQGGLGGPFHAARSIGEVVADPQLAARCVFVLASTQDGGQMIHVGQPVLALNIHTWPNNPPS
jgi:hypothetical protein